MKDAFILHFDLPIESQNGENNREIASEYKHLGMELTFTTWNQRISRVKNVPLTKRHRFTSNARSLFSMKWFISDQMLINDAVETS